MSNRPGMPWRGFYSVLGSYRVSVMSGAELVRFTINHNIGWSYIDTPAAAPVRSESAEYDAVKLRFPFVKDEALAEIALGKPARDARKKEIDEHADMLIAALDALP